MQNQSSKSKVFNVLLLLLVNGEHKRISKRPLTDAAVQQPKKRRKTNKDAEEEVSFNIHNWPASQKESAHL